MESRDNATGLATARRGLSLIEILVVIAAIAAIAGLALPAYSALHKRARLSHAADLVRMVVAEILIYPRREITVPAISSGNEHIRRFWDFDGGRGQEGDGVLDGDPELDEKFDADDREAAQRVGYRGFLGTSGMVLKRDEIDSQGRVLDPWRRPLRIAFAADAYGSTDLGVFSLGPNGLAHDEDDIGSWK